MVTISAYDIQIWKAATPLRADTSAEALLALRIATGDAEKLIHRLKKAALCRLDVTADTKLAIARAALQEKLLHMDHAGRLKVLREADLPPIRINRFSICTSRLEELTGIRKFFVRFPPDV